MHQKGPCASIKEGELIQQFKEKVKEDMIVCYEVTLVDRLMRFKEMNRD